MVFHSLCEKRKCIVSDLGSDRLTPVEKIKQLERRISGKKKRSEEQALSRTVWVGC